MATGIPIPSSPLTDPRTGNVSLDWFLFLGGETKAWTPTDASGAALVFTNVSAAWTQNGRLIFAYASFTYPATASGAAALIGGLPVTVPNANYARQGLLTFTTSATAKIIIPTANATTAAFLAVAGAGCTNANMSGTTNNIILIYPVQ